MSNNEQRNGKELAIFAAIALVGGGSGSVLQNKFVDPRPDPFTGSEGTALEIRIKALEQSSNRKWEKLDDIHAALHRIEVNMAAVAPRIQALEKTRAKDLILKQ